MEDIVSPVSESSPIASPNLHNPLTTNPSTDWRAPDTDKNIHVERRSHLNGSKNWEYHGNRLSQLSGIIDMPDMLRVGLQVRPQVLDGLPWSFQPALASGALNRIPAQFGLSSKGDETKSRLNPSGVERYSKPPSHLPASIISAGREPGVQGISPPYNGFPHASTCIGSLPQSASRNVTSLSPLRSSISTAHDPGAASILHQPVKAFRAQSVLDRVRSFRTGTFQRRSAYGRLGDDRSRPAKHSRAPSIIQRYEAHDVEDGFDLSTYDGSIGLNNMHGKCHQRTASNVSDDEGVLAAEYHQLEAQGKLTGGLGAGLNGLLEHFSTDPQSVKQPIYQRPVYLPRATPKYTAQQMAEKKGEIVVVAETPAVDIGHLSGDGGGEPPDRERIATDSTQEKSFYFPEDPDMPNWRPISMHWTYISLLTILALALAGFQEYLCLHSQKLAREGTGLLEFIHPHEVSFMAYFSWKYAPTIVLLAYGILWQTTDFEVKRLEPYYQLSRPTGALAAESLNIDYLTFWSYLTPFKALRYKQWAVVCSAVGYLCAGGLIPTLQSASVVIIPDRSHRKKHEPKFVRIDPMWSRLMEAGLVAVALCGTLLLLQLRRKSGLLSDPKGVAGIAAMATRSHILYDFRGLDLAKHNVIHEQLKHRRYLLHKSSLWQGEYIRNTNGEASYGNRKRENPHLLMLTLKAGIPYIFSLLLFALLLPVLLFTKATVATEKIPFLLTALASLIKLVWGTLECNVRMIEPFYILSKRHAPPRTLTLDYTGTVPGWIVIKSFINKHFLVSVVSLGALLTEVLTVCASALSVDGKRFVPGHARGTSDPPSESQPSLPAHLLFGRGGRGPNHESHVDNHHNSDQTFRSFWVSFTLALAILVYLISVACIVYHRRRHKFLPRPPGTISSVLAFVHQSRMLLDFIDTERMNEAQMAARLEGLRKADGCNANDGEAKTDGTEGESEAEGSDDESGRIRKRRAQYREQRKVEGKSYGLGWFRGMDGEDHLGVDEEPLTASYVHGVDWRLGRLASAGGLNDWETY